MTAARARGQQHERGRARTLVILADVIAAAAVAVLTTDALRPGVPLRALLTIITWAVVPRIAALWIEQPRALFASRQLLLRARILAVMAVFVGVGVSRMALAAIPAIGGSSGFEMVLLIACWAAGFTLRDNGAYRVYEPLCCATLVAALLRGSTLAIPLVATAFLALLFSAALRHQLGKSSVSNRVRRVNIRNAGLVAAVLAAVLLAVFAIGDLGASELIRRTRSAPSARLGGASGNDRDDPQVERSDPEPGQMPDEQADAPEDFAPDWSAGAHGANFAGALGLRRRGVVRTEALGEEILRVKPSQFAPGPRPDTLWRARTYVRFDSAKEEWVDQGLTLWSRPSMRGDTMLRAVPDLGSAQTTWQVTVMTERLDCLILPYFAAEVRFPVRNPDDLDLRANADGDVCTQGGELTMGQSHRILLRPFDANRPSVRGILHTAEAPSNAYLEIPEAGKLAEKVRAVARSELGEGGSLLSEKLAKLENWFRRSYRYRLDPADGKIPDSLTEFMLQTRAGDCRHLASAAALLLRASGVPARIADGFTGAELDAETGAYGVMNSWAHVWVEVSSQSGWIPIDPTRWVAPPALGRRPQGVGPRVRFGNPELKAKPEDADQRPGKTDDPRKPDPPKPPESSQPPWLLTAVTALMAIVVVFLIARSWRRAPEAEDPKKEDEEAPKDPEAAPEPGIDFVPRTPAEHLLLDYAHLQGDLAGSGQERQSHETPREHGRRISASAGEPAESAFGSLVPLVDDGLYGKVDLTDGDLSRGRGAIGAIRKELV